MAALLRSRSRNRPTCLCPGHGRPNGYSLVRRTITAICSAASYATPRRIAFITATRKARQPLVTAAVRELAIEADARTGDLVYIGGRVTKAGDRSLTVHTELTLETERSGASRTTSGEFVMVTV